MTPWRACVGTSAARPSPISSAVATAPGWRSAIHTPLFQSSSARYRADERLIRALYGDDVTSLLNDAEEALFRIYLHDDDEPERKEKIIFCIGGTSRLLLMNPDEHGIRAASELIRTVFNLNENRT